MAHWRSFNKLKGLRGTEVTILLILVGYTNNLSNLIIWCVHCKFVRRYVGVREDTGSLLFSSHETVYLFIYSRVIALTSFPYDVRQSFLDPPSQRDHQISSGFLLWKNIGKLSINNPWMKVHGRWQGPWPLCRHFFCF